MSGSPETLPIESIWVSRKVAQVTVRGARDKPGVAADLFQHLFERNINVEMIFSGPSAKGRVNLAFLIRESDLPKVEDEIVDDITELVDAREVVIDPKVAIITFRGTTDMLQTPGIAAFLFGLLAQAGANIELVGTCMDSISVVIRRDRLDTALDVLMENLTVEITEGYYLG